MPNGWPGAQAVADEPTGLFLPTVVLSHPSALSKVVIWLHERSTGAGESSRHAERREMGRLRPITLELRIFAVSDEPSGQD